MFDLNDFLLELDHMYATNPKGVEAYLKSGLEEAGNVWWSADVDNIK